MALAKRWVSSMGRVMAVPIHAGATFSRGSPQSVVEGPYVAPNAFRTYDVSADGRRFYVRRTFGASTLPATTVYVNWMEGFRKR